MSFGELSDPQTPFDATTVQLLLIDVQEKLFPTIFNKDSLQKNLQLLLEMAKVFELPVLCTEQYPKGLGSTIPDLKKYLPSPTQYFEKIHFSCVKEAGFQGHLGSQKMIITAGIESHICVYQTVLDLLDDFIVWVPEDGVGSRTEANWKCGLSLMRQEKAWICSTETLVFKMLKKAGTSEFKALAPLLK